MRKSIWMMMVMMMVMMMAGLMSFGADLQDATVTLASVTTNSVTLDSAVLDASGEIMLMVIDVANTDPFDLDITDAVTGAVIFSADDVAADVTLIPRLITRNTAGVALATNAPACVLGMKVTAGAATGGTNSVTISVIVDKNP